MADPTFATTVRASIHRPLIALLLFSLSALMLAYQSPLWADWTTAGVVLSGFYDLEGRSSNHPFRWTDGRAHVWMSGVGRQPYRLTLSLSASRPNSVELPTVRVLANDRLIVTFKALRPVTDFAVDLPADALNASGDLDVRIDSDTFAPPNDLRTLGVTVYAVKVETISEQRQFVWPAFMPSVWTVLAAAMVYLTLRERRMAQRVTWVAFILLLVVLSIGIAAMRIPTSAALPWVVLATTAAYALTLK